MALQFAAVIMAKKVVNNVNGNGKEGLFETTWQNLRSAWREIIRVSTRSDTSRDANPDTLRKHIRACLDEHGGEVSARSRAAGLARSYLGFSQEERRAFLRLLNSEFGVDSAAVDRAIEALKTASTEHEREGCQRRLRRALQPERVMLLRKFNTLHSGPRFLVELRRELIDLKKESPELEHLEADLKDLLRAWFDIGFLELQSISWNSPASLLEKLGHYEAVHRIRSWQDLKSRLDSDRRCFAFFHPCMPEEPLIFIEVALVNGLADQIQALLDERASPIEPDEADTAIFYSISNTQKGLVGISFGNFLIKQVVDQLRREQPNLKRFATLSPIPGFLDWLFEELREGRVTVRPAEAKRLNALTGDGDPPEKLAAALQGTKWARDEELSATLRPILLRLCASYLLEAKRSDGLRARNPVAHFHLSNGARIEQLNWLADVSTKGMQDSAGIMVNYLYRLDRIERYHEEYRSKGKIAASSTVAALVK